MIQLGISAFYHDAAACIVKDGKVIAAAEEERFTGVKHDARFPLNALKWCLLSTDTAIDDIDEVCWYEDRELKKQRVLKTFNKHFLKTLLLRFKFLKEFKTNTPEKHLSRLGYKGKIKYISHHLSHAAFSFYTSPFRESAILTVDGVGEWETVTISKGVDNKIVKKININYPNSLGLFYSAITSYLGFKPNEGEYKVMGLSSYGNSNKYYNTLKKVFKHTSNKFWIDLKYFRWEYSDSIMYTKKLYRLLKIPPRIPGDKITTNHKNLAAALQRVYEEELFRLGTTVKNITGSKNLCLAGGCAYNGKANNNMYKLFDKVHIPYAPSDAGSAIGACLASYKGLKKDNTSPFLGPEYSDRYIHTVLNSATNKIKFYKLTEDKLIKKTAHLILSGNIIAWFQGKMEFGARALGNRSILASALDPAMKDKVNKIIKKRENFRPFAPSIIEEKSLKFFRLKEPSPYMSKVVSTVDDDGIARFHKLPSTTHIDSTSRVQTVNKKQNSRYYKLLVELGRNTNTPAVLNTSFNFKDQPITRTPEQALKRFLQSKLDYLIIGNYIVSKKYD